MADTKSCPYCGEEIRAEAIRCRYCRSRLVTLDPERWHRAHPEARLGGVAAALAHVFVVPVGAVRLGFVVLTLLPSFHLLGAMAYGSLMLVIPARPGEDSLLERLLRAALSLAGVAGGRRNLPPAPRRPSEPSA